MLKNKENPGMASSKTITGIFSSRNYFTSAANASLSCRPTADFTILPLLKTNRLGMLMIANYSASSG